MLSENQITDVWERQIAAEVRSLYFGELASQYSKQKQWITFLTFFLSSGAAGSLLAKAPVWVPILLSTLVAVVTAYTIAINLDLTIRSMAKFHYSWSELALGYQRLWDNVHAEDAQLTFESFARRERDLAELATTDAHLRTISSVRAAVVAVTEEAESALAWVASSLEGLSYGSRGYQLVLPEDMVLPVGKPLLPVRTGGERTHWPSN